MLGPGDWRCLHRTLGRDPPSCCVGCGQERPKETAGLGSAFRGRSLPPLGTDRRMEPGGLGAGSALPRPRGQLSGPASSSAGFFRSAAGGRGRGGWHEPHPGASRARRGQPSPGSRRAKLKGEAFFPFRFFCFKDLPASSLLRLFKVSWPVLPPGDLMRLLGHSSFKSRSHFKAL